MSQLILFGLISGLFSLVGGFIILWKAEWAKKIILILISFSAGAFLGVGFLDILPEAVEAAKEPHTVFIYVLGGFFVFFLLERLLMRFTHHHSDQHATEHSEHSESLPFLIVLGDSLHNFLDGILVALAYVANPALGLPTALAVAAHEVPQEIGDFTILLDSGWSKFRIIVVNVASSLLSVAGVVVGYYFGTRLEGYLPYFLGFVGGTFIYIAACDLIPEIQDRAKHRHVTSIILAFLLGLLLVGYLVSISGHH